MDNKWICTGAFNYIGQGYTIWVKPMYKWDDNTQHFESMVKSSTPEEIKEAIENHGPQYLLNLII